MLVNIDEIEAGGLVETWDMKPDQVNALLSGDKAGFKAVSPVNVEATFKKLDRRVILKARSNVELSCPCGRCLTQTSVVVPVDFELTLIPRDEYDDQPRAEKDSGQRSVAASFEMTEVDEEMYEGKTIDLDPIFREQLLLALPGYPVCREGCKGLCPVCGTNLNDRECGCDRHVPDPRWAGLEKLKPH